MSPENFRKICLPEVEISLYLYNFSKEVSQLTYWQAYKKFRIIWNKCTNIPGMPPKNFREISHTEQELSLYLSNFSKEVSQLTGWQTYKRFWIILIQCTNNTGNPQKISEIYLIQISRYAHIGLISARKHSVQYYRNVSRRFQKDISSRNRVVSEWSKTYEQKTYVWTQPLIVFTPQGIQLKVGGCHSFLPLPLNTPKVTCVQASMCAWLLACSQTS